jgi:hypothetical protein
VTQILHIFGRDDDIRYEAEHGAYALPFEATFELDDEASDYYLKGDILRSKNGLESVLIHAWDASFQGPSSIKQEVINTLHQNHEFQVLQQVLKVSMSAVVHDLPTNT